MMSLGLMEQDGESLQHLSGFLEATAAFLYAAATTKLARLIDQSIVATRAWTRSQWGRNRVGVDKIGLR